MKDWMTEAAEKIHTEYPRVLRECNDHTPLPWLRAVIREAAPFKDDTAYMRVPRCETCAHWRRYPDNAYSRPVGDCTAIIVYNDPTANRNAQKFLRTCEDFGCMQHKEKGV